MTSSTASMTSVPAMNSMREELRSVVTVSITTAPTHGPSMHSVSVPAALAPALVLGSALVLLVLMLTHEF